MSTSTPQNTAFDLLMHYAMRSRACALATVDVKPPEQIWTGIGFSLGEAQFLAPMDDISEIINLPPCTKIPRTKTFVRGAANIRGAIIPVIDLMIFFQKRSSRVARLRRLLVIEYRESFTGLVVDDILGMQHFTAHHYESRISSNLDPCFHPYLSGTYFRSNLDDEQEEWPVLDLDRLLTDQSLENLSV